MGICFGNFAKEAVDSRMKAPVSSPNLTLPSSPGPNVVIRRTEVSVDKCSSDSVDHQGEILPIPNLKIFPFAELKTATRNFRPDSLLGEGGFGKVYRAWVDEKSLAPARIGFGMMVAVKKLNPDSTQGVEEWNSEVSFLGRLSHPNLVKLLGYCWEDNRELLLVYEFMPKGSLDNHLFRKEASCERLTWGVRLKILIGAARGLVFLHSNERKIIYRDFKAANILLDANFKAKLADFGLARDGPTGEDSHVSTRIMGTYGYAAPEYLTTGHLYLKSDVYGFGVVLLETLSGLWAYDPSRPPGEQSLVDFARTVLLDKRKISHFMDASLGDDYPKKAAFEAGQLALRCVNNNPRNRPSMEEVLNKLKQIQKLRNAKEHRPERSSPYCRRSPYNARHAVTPTRRP